MFYICKKREDGLFGVMDTKDEIVEYYTPQEILDYVVKLHIDIKGVSKKKNGSYDISVLKPTKVKKLSNEDLGNSDEVYTRKLSYFKRKLIDIIQELTGQKPNDFKNRDGFIYCEPIKLNENYYLKDMGFSIDNIMTNQPESQYFSFSISDRNGDILGGSYFRSSFIDWRRYFETGMFRNPGYPYESLFSYRTNCYINKYKNLSEDDLRRLASDSAKSLCGAICSLTGLVITDTLILFDGMNSMGYRVSIGSGYTMNIYFSPEVVNSRCIKSSRFGLDLYQNNNLIEDSHLDLSFKDLKSDTFDSVISSYKYNHLFRDL